METTTKKTAESSTGWLNCTAVNRTSTSDDVTDESQQYQRYLIIAVVLFTLLMLFICAGNALTIAAFCRRPCLRTRANFYIVQMAVADLFLGLFLIQHIVNNAIPRLLFDRKNCIFALANSLLTCAASLSAILAMNIDRFRSIMWPYSYQCDMTRKDYYISVLQIWVPASLFGIVSPAATNKELPHMAHGQCIYVHILYRDFFMYVLLPYLYFILIAILLLNIPMFYVANKQASAICNQQVNRSDEPNPEQNHFRKKLHLLKTVFIIFLTFYGCWLPYTVLISMEAYDNSFYNNPAHYVYNLTRYFAFPVLLNSAINPIIYAVRMRPFRKEFVKMLTTFLRSSKIFPQRNVSP